MSTVLGDESFFCTYCGAEDWSCGHDDDRTGSYCGVCGVIPGDGLYCGQTRKLYEVETNCPYQLER